MKTKIDLQLAFRDEFGHYPDDDDKYIAWLEEKVLAEMNKGFVMTKHNDCKHPYVVFHHGVLQCGDCGSTKGLEHSVHNLPGK